MKKAQQAMEFLVTYGWAILIVLVVIAALAYLGILSPGRFLPSSCILMPGLGCTDFKVTSSGIAITVMNGYGKKFDTFSITVQGNPEEPCVGETLTAVEGLGNGEIETLTSTCAVAPAGGTRFKADLLINYQTSGELVHSKIGSIATMVEGESVFEEGVADEEICQNAQTAGLCPGLDIVFGAGYRTSCCSQYTSCCLN